MISNHKTMIGICAIIKDCYVDNLIEWIEWHKLIGFDYFFIYDNGSKTPIKQTLSKYENIIVYDYLGDVMQLHAYNDCISKQKNLEQPKCEWIAFIDDDEFIVIESGDIKQFLSNKNCSGIGLNWHMFGSNNIKNKTDEKQIFKFTKHSFDNTDVNKHIKSIVRPELVFNFSSPHSCNYTQGNCLDIDGEIIPYAFVNKQKNEVAWVNHYFCRSEEEYLHKINRGRSDCNIKHNIEAFNSVNEESIYESFKIIDIYKKLKSSC